MLTFAGLRGAVAYACARDFPAEYGNTDKFVAATIAIAVFTIVFMGGSTEPLMEYLQIRTNVDYKEYMKQWHAKRQLKGRFHRLEYHYIFRNVVRPSREDPYIRRTMTPLVDHAFTSMDYSMNHMMDESIGSHLPHPMGITSNSNRVRYIPPLPTAVEEPSNNIGVAGGGTIELPNALSAIQSADVDTPSTKVVEGEPVHPSAHTSELPPVV